MEKMITIAGIELDNSNARESLHTFEREMREQPFCMVEEISMNMLLFAQNDDKVREALRIVSRTVIGELGVLEAVGADNYQRKREIESHEFFYGLMERLESRHWKVFLLGQKVEDTDDFLEYFQNEFLGLEVVGVAAMEESVGTDAVVNEINAAAPEMILCTIPSPQREHFLLQCRDKISASLWYGMEPDKLLPKGHRIMRWMRRVLHRKRLARHVGTQEGDPA